MELTTAYAAAEKKTLALDEFTTTWSNYPLDIHQYQQLRTLKMSVKQLNKETPTTLEYQLQIILRCLEIQLLAKFKFSETQQQHKRAKIVEQIQHILQKIALRMDLEDPSSTDKPSIFYEFVGIFLPFHFQQHLPDTLEKIHAYFEIVPPNTNATKRRPNLRTPQLPKFNCTIDSAKKETPKTTLASVVSKPTRVQQQQNHLLRQVTLPSKGKKGSHQRNGSGGLKVCSQGSRARKRLRASPVAEPPKPSSQDLKQSFKKLPTQKIDTPLHKSRQQSIKNSFRIMKTPEKPITAAKYMTAVASTPPISQGQIPARRNPIDRRTIVFMSPPRLNQQQPRSTSTTTKLAEFS